MSGGRVVQVTKTMFQVESEARWRMWALFGLLLFMVTVCLSVCVWVVVAGIELVLDARSSSLESSGHFLSFSLSLPGVGSVVLGSMAVAVGYWYVSRIGARDHLVRVMHAQQLDPADRYHQRLADIVEEMRIATGGPPIRCLTVPTVGMNAFAFSDLHGGACIGVTEGALSRLSRAQLEAVVAHEFGHVLSGDYVTATTACLLFGVYTSLGDSLGGAVETGVDTRVNALLLAIPLWVLLGLLQVASAVVNSAISRQGEWAADLAAARYTRDPLSLAQALQMMVRHPGGSGYIPDGLSALCIRPTDLNATTVVARAMATHPPVNDRIVALLNIAHVSWGAFQEQCAAAEAACDQREHVTQAPGVAGATPGAERLAQMVAAPLMAAAPVAAAPVVTAAHAAPVAAASIAPAAAPVAAAPAIQAVAPAPAAVAVVVAASVLAAAPAAAASPQSGTPPAAASSLRFHEPVEQAVACPDCHAALERCDYEGTEVFACRTCAGRLATTPQVQRILTRREMRFDDRQQALADYVVEHGDELRRNFVRNRTASAATLIFCPRCGRTMMRRHFSYDVAVEVDYCMVCDLYWFQKDELEVLQVITERQAQ